MFRPFLALVLLTWLMPGSRQREDEAAIRQVQTRHDRQTRGIVTMRLRMRTCSRWMATL